MATFFFDIDGTLAYKGVLVEDTIEILQHLRKLGHVVCICSGRGIHYVESMFAKYSDAIIACNGRYISYQGNCIYKMPLDQKSMLKFHEIAKKAKGACHFTGEYQRYAYEIEERYKEALYSHLQQDITQITPMDKVETYSFEVDFLSPTTFEQMQLAYGNEVILNNHFDNFSADASTTSFDKGNGIEKLMELVKLNLKDTYAFGDGSNDVCMFRVCTHGIAMGNAVQPLKQVAEYITNDFQKKGIRIALLHYNFL